MDLTVFKLWIIRQASFTKERHERLAGSSREVLADLGLDEQRTSE
jgi:hypothetical protein